MTPAWIPEDPEGHRWVTPESPPCPNCECCAARLCAQARERGLSCSLLQARDPGQMSTARCPCSALGRTVAVDVEIAEDALAERTADAADRGPA